ncbi:MAG: hypothetical protein IT428_31665 [Planctomycetaceae bacterium]|nr:hypothetical protein [Planctomycetaceae bacterium]
MSERPPSRLNQLEGTRWSDVYAPTNASLSDCERRARIERFFQQYSPSVRRYLQRLLESHPQREELIAECFQHFAIKFLEGKFSQCSPGECGRFRTYLKATLRNLAMTEFRKRELQPLDSGIVRRLSVPVDESDAMEEILRDECLRNALRRMSEEDEFLHWLLLLRSGSPESSYDELAERVSGRIRDSVTPAWVRKQVFLARAHLRKCIRDEVASTLAEPTTDAVDDELTQLGLKEYVERKRSTSVS